MNELIERAGSKKLAIKFIDNRIDHVNYMLSLSRSTGTKQFYNDKLEELNQYKNQLS